MSKNRPDKRTPVVPTSSVVVPPVKRKGPNPWTFWIMGMWAGFMLTTGYNLWNKTMPPHIVWVAPPPPSTLQGVAAIRPVEKREVSHISVIVEDHCDDGYRKVNVKLSDVDWVVWSDAGIEPSTHWVCMHESLLKQLKRPRLVFSGKDLEDRRTK